MEAPASFEEFRYLCNLKYGKSRPFAFNHHTPSTIKYKVGESEWDYIRNDDDLERAYNFAKGKDDTDLKLIL